MIHLLPDDLHQALLGYPAEPVPRRKLQTFLRNLEPFGLAGAQDGSDPTNLPLPEGLPLAKDLARQAALDLCGDYLDRLEQMVDWDLPEVPETVPSRPGLWRYQDGWTLTDQVPSGAVVQDFETVEMPDGSWRPFMYAAYDGTYWYLWLGDIRHPANLPTVVPGPRDTLVVNHNVQYDRAFLDTEYLRADSGNRFFDTMAAFIAVRGMSNQQRAVYKATKRDGFGPRWVQETSTHGLAAVYQFYTGQPLSKEVRGDMVAGGIQWVQQHLRDVALYCLQDVRSTLEVFRHVYPELKLAQPHPASWAGQLLLGSAWLPLSADRFPGYYQRAEQCYQEVLADIRSQLVALAIAAVDQAVPGLDYTPKKWQGRGDLVDEAILVNPTADEEMSLYLGKPDDPRIIRRLDYLADPQMTRFLGHTKAGKAYLEVPAYLADFLTKPSLKKRQVPLLLGVTYLGQPVYWDGDTKTGWWATAEGAIPHPETPGKRVTDLFAKGFVSAWEAETLASSQPGVQEMLRSLVSTINWVSLRKRVAAIHTESPEGYPVTLPQLVVTGTITRRAADSLWQVASNPKPKRIGTELKSIVEAPPGYRVLGADVSSQEAWLASALGDAAEGYCGSTPLGVMVLVGTKKAGTEMHTIVANEIGASRDLAKVLNYATIYGQGLEGATNVIRKAQPHLSLEEAKQIALAFQKTFKGTRLQGRWYGGLGSEAFNGMASRVASPVPRTPALGAALTHSLRGTKDFATTRGNWVIQSSGVDFRDLLIVFSTWLYQRCQVEARLLMTIHDEIRFIVAEADTVKAAWLLQVAHVLVRALFIEALGLNGIPQGIAWFPEVDVDRYLRKDSSDPCQTPSQPGLPLGETWTPADILRRLSTLVETPMNLIAG